jgi:hypothetical protein
MNVGRGARIAAGDREQAQIGASLRQRHMV